MRNIDNDIKLEWNVFIYDINERQIELFNVSHMEDTDKKLSKY